MAKTKTSGLKGQQAPSPGHRPGYEEWCAFALKGQKPYHSRRAFALSGRNFILRADPGRCPGL
ncbi:MAG: hypothetical protein IJM81_07990, partial [Prevotella sp.]|nr:hypothetical protein [Prevotella sp.]